MTYGLKYRNIFVYHRVGRLYDRAIEQTRKPASLTISVWVTVSLCCIQTGIFSISVLKFSSVFTCAYVHTHTHTHTHAYTHTRIHTHTYAHTHTHTHTYTHTHTHTHTHTQLSYADMLNRVDPLRKELETLEKKAEITQIKGEEMTRIIHEMEQSIAQYKEEYAVLISEANAIKADLATVEAKVQCLLGSLTHSLTILLLASVLCVCTILLASVLCLCFTACFSTVFMYYNILFASVLCVCTIMLASVLCECMYYTACFSTV